MGRKEKDFASLLARKEGSVIHSVSALFDSAPPTRPAEGLGASVSVKRPGETQDLCESATRAKKSKVDVSGSPSASAPVHSVFAKKKSKKLASAEQVAPASGEEAVSWTNKHDRARAASKSSDAQTAPFGKELAREPKQDSRKAACQLEHALRLCKKVKLMHAKQREQQRKASKAQTGTTRQAYSGSVSSSSHTTKRQVTIPSAVETKNGAEEKDKDNRIRKSHATDAASTTESATHVDDSKDGPPAAKKDDDNEVKKSKKKKAKKKPLTEEDKAARMERTVFVGNIPLDMEPKDMKKLATQALSLYEANLQESDVDWEVQDGALIATKIHNEACKVCVGHKLVRLAGMEVGTLKDLKKLWSSKSGPVFALIATKDRIQVDALYFRSLPVDEKWKNKIKAGAARKDFSNGTSKNCYVVLKKTEDKQALVMHLHKKEIQGHVLRADFNRKEDHTEGFSRKKSIFVGNLYRLTTEDELLKAFSQFPVDKVRIIRDPVTHVGKGIGFVQFENRKSVPEARKLYITLHERLLRIEKVEEESVRKDKLREKKEAEREVTDAQREKTPGQIRRAEKTKRWMKEQKKIAKAQ